MRPATDVEIRDDLQSEPGFISPVGLVKEGVKTGKPVVVVADASLRTVHNAYGGSNKKHLDLLNINIERDYQPDVEGDIAMAEPGMLSREGGKLVERRGIEVGNIFQLGYHYTNLMNGAEYTDAEGRRQKYYMGCYGIGIGRTLAAIVETSHDERGIVWPESVAPARVYLVQLGGDDAVAKAAEELYAKLTKSGVEVLYDDRDMGAGAKFADADLIGCPVRLTVSKKTLAEDSVELKYRTEADFKLVKLADLAKTLV
jgi:prolyl-tRNA synthetase